MKTLGSAPEMIASTNDRCGEGPLWDWREGQFYWNDTNGRVIHRMSRGGGGVVTTPASAQPAGMALAEGGGLVIAGTDGIHAFRDGKMSLIMKEIGGQTPPFNDILATPAGRIYAGTYFWGDVAMEKTGALHLIDLVKKSATVLDEGIELSNGIGLSPDGRTLYYADSTARRIYAYDVNRDETLSRKRVFVSVGSDEGIPDGLTVDAEGYIWSAQWYGAQVVRYDPDGHVERQIALPVKQVSSVAFGGDDLDCLYITTAGEHWASAFVPRGYSASAGTIGGPLFAVRAGIRGLKEHEVKWRE